MQERFVQKCRIQEYVLKRNAAKAGTILPFKNPLHRSGSISQRILSVLVHGTTCFLYFSKPLHDSYQARRYIAGPRNFPRKALSRMNIPEQIAHWIRSKLHSNPEQIAHWIRSKLHSNPGQIAHWIRSKLHSNSGQIARASLASLDNPRHPCFKEGCPCQTRGCPCETFESHYVCIH